MSCSKGLEVNSYIYNTNTSQYTNLGTQPGVCNGLVNHCGTDTYPYDTGTYETATPMNSSGEIVGFYNPTSGSTSPNLFVYSGGMSGSTSTVTTPGTNLSSITGASGINNNGVVVGNYQLGANPNPTGFYYSGGTCYTINGMACPEGINGNEVVGADNDGVAAIYTLGNSSATSIGTLGGYESVAYAVSSAGTVVGLAYNTASTQVAFVYGNGTMTNLNTQSAARTRSASCRSRMGSAPTGNISWATGPWAADRSRATRRASC